MPVSVARVRPIVQSLPMLQHVSGYRQHATLAGLAATTIKRRGTALRLLVTESRIDRPDQLTRDSIERWLLTRPNPQTRASYLADVRAWCKWLVRDGIIDADPSIGIPTPKIPTRLPTPLSTDDVRRLRETIHDPVDRAILTLGLFAGLRVSEIGALDAGDIDRGRGTILVRQGKGAKDRVVPAAAIVCAVTAPVGPAIGLALQGQTVSRHIRSAFALAGVVGHRPHDLRATFATELLRSTGDVAMVSAVLGHSSLATTQRYLLVDPPARSVVDGLFAAAA